jgi:hypothetical protein
MPRFVGNDRRKCSCCRRTRQARRRTFPVLLRLKPLCFAQEVLEQSAPFRADALLELGESFLLRAWHVERFRLAKFDAVNLRQLDHALEIDLWKLFPHDLENLLAVVLPVLLQVAKEFLAELITAAYAA